MHENVITEGVIDLEPVSPRPMAVALGGVQDPPISSTNVELVGLGR